MTPKLPEPFGKWLLLRSTTFSIGKRVNLGLKDTEEKMERKRKQQPYLDSETGHNPWLT